MAGSVNKVILVGNVGNDPEIRTFGNGGKVANLSLATSESWRDKRSGEKMEKTEWHRVALFGEGLVGVVERYVKKGHKLYIEGQLETRKWQDRDGNDRYTTEVKVTGFNGAMKMLSGGNGGNGGGSGGSGGSDMSRDDADRYAEQSGGSSARRGGDNPDFDDEIPF